ncbi:protein-L-isoaspartate(D-aspartate) O-methyltransferase [Noviherbaspirillum sp.]|uniref:protein-L-isoaspartate(D-aspartate) O-methyltransferase n=1 Tax=Noviherbaspirillum sp. TaxID=1926288 RepID=UPI002FE0612E
MTGKDKRFPLPLASVVESSPRAGRAQPSSVIKVATPQTATRNAAQNLQQNQARTAALSDVAGRTLAKTGTSPAHLTIRQDSSRASESVRLAMAARIAKQGVKDAKVLAAMQAVPRHMFIEQGLSSQAYIDASLPIGHHQTISQPYIVARMIEVMRDNASAGKLDRVLEIGTGCGYQAAVLSLVAKEVYSIERIKPLHELAKSNLRPLRIANIRLHYGDGMLGLPQAAPFDGIILAAAGLEVPPALLDQLAIGGRLVAPVGDRHQVLQLIERVGKFEWTNTTLEACHFVPLRAGIV